MPWQCLPADGAATTGQQPGNDDYRLEGPFTHGNLSVFLIHGRDKIKGTTFITLQEALIQKKVIVRENTFGERTLDRKRFRARRFTFSQATLSKGGQQDRMMAVDLILPPRSGKIPISAFCVENGRWSQRGNEAWRCSTRRRTASPVARSKLAAKMKARREKFGEK